MMFSGSHIEVTVFGKRSMYCCVYFISIINIAIETPILHEYWFYIRNILQERQYFQILPLKIILIQRKKLQKYGFKLDILHVKCQYRLYIKTIFNNTLIFPKCSFSFNQIIKRIFSTLAINHNLLILFELFSNEYGYYPSTFATMVF